MTELKNQTNNLFELIESGATFGDVLEAADQKINFNLCNLEGFNLLTFAIKHENVGAADALLVAGLSLDAKDLNQNSGRLAMQKAEGDFAVLLDQYVKSEEEKNGSTTNQEFINFSSSFGDAFLQDFQYANRYPHEEVIEGTGIKRFQFGITWREVGEDSFEDSIIEAVGLQKWENRFELFGVEVSQIKKNIVLAHVQDTAYPSFEIKNEPEIYADLDFHSKNIAGIISFDIIAPSDLKSHLAELFYTNCQPIGIAVSETSVFAAGEFNYNPTKFNQSNEWQTEKPYRIQ